MMAGGIPVPGTDGIVELDFGCSESGCGIGVEINWIQLLIDIIEELISLFSGRPRDEATQQVAHRLCRARNPIWRLCGLEYQRLLRDENIVISSSDPGDQAQLSRVFSQFVRNTMRQGATLHEAERLGVYNLSRAAQAGAPISPRGQVPLHGGAKMYGSQKLQRMSEHARQIGDEKGLTGKKLDRYVEKYVWQRSTLLELWTIKFFTDEQWHNWQQEHPDNDDGTGGGPPNPCKDPCEIAVIEQLTSIALSLTQITTVGGGGSSVDLSQVIAELKCICDALSEPDASAPRNSPKLKQMLDYLVSIGGYPSPAAQIVDA